MCSDMTAHHLLCEETAILKCLYCGNDLNQNSWKSRFSIKRHYKELKCACGKLSWVHVNIQGSGHDTFMKKKVNTLEQKIIK